MPLTRYMLSSIVFLLLGGATVDAHPLIRSADPRPNSVLRASPSEIRIGFTEGLESAFSGLEVDATSGKAIATDDAVLDPNDSRALIVHLKAKLAPGTYIVKWHCVGADTHRVTGHYGFQVNP